MYLDRLRRAGAGAERRPLQALIAPLLAAGFVLEALVEPQPTAAFAQKDPEDYEELRRRPGFLCVRAGKD